MSFKLELIGFDRLQNMLDPSKFPARFRRHVKKATQRNAQLGASEVIRAIYKGVPPPNAPLTIALKGSSRTLVDSGNLAGSVSGKATDWNEATIRVNRRARPRPSRYRGKRQSTKPGRDIAAILYFGATIKVTDKMRRLFYALSHLKGSPVKPLKASTKVIVIRPRKFLDAALAPNLQRKYQLNWEGAVKLALLGIN